MFIKIYLEIEKQKSIEMKKVDWIRDVKKEHAKIALSDYLSAKPTLFYLRS